MGIRHELIGENYLRNYDAPIPIEGSVLPEHYSNYSDGIKIVTFYASPDLLLRTSYILRKQGWRDETGLYQRMINNRKITGIRKYLLSEKRVFINNIIATLPKEARILDSDRNSIDLSTLKKPKAVTIEIPDKQNTIGLIDGQHRVFSYYESKVEDEESIIKQLREQTNLLVTALIMPQSMTTEQRLRYEANLFLEINSNQSNASSDLKQSIRLLLNPFSTESIARAVISHMDMKGPLEDMIQNHFYETQKLKPSSIVSFGLKPIVKLGGQDSLFYTWNNPNKDRVISDRNEEVLKEYILYCASSLNIFISACKSCIDKDQWAKKKKNTNGILSTVTVNAFIIAFRFHIENAGFVNDFQFYSRKLQGLKKFDFSNYGGSQYTMMGNDIYQKFLK